MKNLQDSNEEGKYFLKAKKSLGQHFLRSEKAISQIVNSIAKPHLVSPINKGGTTPEIVFEIGPGEGVLTEKLLEKGFTVIVIEIDKRSIEILRQKFEKEIENKKLFIIEKDCLEIDYAKVLWEIFGEMGGGKAAAQTYSLVGNIPYYITGAIFRNTFEQKVLPKEVIFLIQKEVAQRIVARDSKQSLLSVSIKIFSDQTKIVDIVKAGSFVPPPKVDSAILKIGNIQNTFHSSTEKQDIFFKILRASFSHKRKFLLTNLKTDLEEVIFNKYFSRIQEVILENYSDKVRAEDLSIETWKEIIKLV